MTSHGPPALVGRNGRESPLVVFSQSDSLCTASLVGPRPVPPRGLRPGERNGIPDVAQAITTHQGAELCAAHLAQSAGIQPGRSGLLVATATMSPAMLGQLAGTR